MSKSQEFVIFSIGPVQSYIATARRTQDLWAGSRLLSVLMTAGLEAVRQMNVDYRFPLPDEDGRWPDSVPNRAVLLVDGEQGTAVAQAMERAVRQKWSGIAHAVKSYFQSEIIGSQKIAGWEKIWDRQIPQWLECYWGVVPWENGRNYGQVYYEASRHMDARKQLRHFPPHAEPGVKSTLGGVRQALCSEADDWKPNTFWEMVRRRAKLGNVRRGERLDAINSIKRFAQEAEQIAHPNQRFPSTSSIACADFRLTLISRWAELSTQANAFVNTLDDLIDVFTKTERQRLRYAANSQEPIKIIYTRAQNNAGAQHLLRYDGDFFYPDFYSEERFVEALGRERRAKLSQLEKELVNKAAQALQTLYRRCGELDVPISPPSTYFAVLAMDGDRMGQMLSHSRMNREYHKAFSEQLAAFAQKDVPLIIGQEFPGAVVYAGGDDTLVLLPVSCVLKAAEALRLAFETRLNEALTPLGEKATASTGIAIVHQMDPLQTAVEHAHTAEKEAKNRYGRSAIAVSRFVRSGAPLGTGCAWQPTSLSNKTLVEIVTDVQTLIMDDVLSNKFAYDLLAEAPALQRLPQEAHRTELTRLIKRHGPTLHNPEELAETLSQLAAADFSGTTEQIRVGMDGLAEWMILARVLAQGGRER